MDTTTVGIVILFGALPWLAALALLIIKGIEIEIRWHYRRPGFYRNANGGWAIVTRRIYINSRYFY